MDDEISIKDLRNCPLEKEHFFKLDGHPNESGQRLLAKCAKS